MKKNIPVLMKLYTDMLEQNSISADRYKSDVKKHAELQYWYPDYSEKPFSDTMLHSIIVIINRLNNQN